jgi:outer membrane protein assembly factor BamB
MRTVCLFLSAVALSLSVTVLYAANDWPCFRGPEHNGISTESGWNPAALNKPVKTAWTANVKEGFSAVSIKDGKLYTMGFADDKDYVFCLDAATGKEIWKQTYPSKKGSYEGPRATPAVDGDMVYTLGRNGDVLCLKAKDGSIVWKKNVISDYGADNIQWGLASSPYVYGKTLIINAGKHGIMLNKKDGAKIWSSSPGKGGYATAVVYKKGTTPCIAIFGQKGVYGVDAKSGKELWFYSWETSWDVNAADPIVVGDKVFITSGYKRGCTVIDISGTTPKKVWENKELASQFSSPVYVDGYIYGIDGNAGKGELKCIDFKTGAVKWNQNTGFGSLMAADGKLIILNEKKNTGVLTIAELSPQGYKELSSAQVLDPKGAKCWTMPVLCGGKVYCRDSKGQLVCIDVSK